MVHTFLIPSSQPVKCNQNRHDVMTQLHVKKTAGIQSNQCQELICNLFNKLTNNEETLATVQCINNSNNNNNK